MAKAKVQKITEDSFDGTLYDQRRSALIRHIDGKFEATDSGGKVVKGESAYLALSDGDGFFIVTPEQLEADWRKVGG